MLGYYTVVYRVDGDAAAHDAWWHALVPLFLADEPVSISTVSTADEVARLGCIRRILKGRQGNDEKLEAIAAMLVHPDPRIDDVVAAATGGPADA